MGWYFVQAVITNSTCTSHPHIWDSLTSRKSSISENFSKVTNSNLLGWHLLQPNFTGWYIDHWLVWSWPLHMTNKTTGAMPRQCGEGALSFWCFLIKSFRRQPLLCPSKLVKGSLQTGIFLLPPKFVLLYGSNSFITLITFNSALLEVNLLLVYFQVL